MLSRDIIIHIFKRPKSNFNGWKYINGRLENISEQKNLELETIHNETLRKNTGKEKNEQSIREL